MNPQELKLLPTSSSSSSSTSSDEEANKSKLTALMAKYETDYAQMEESLKEDSESSHKNHDSATSETVLGNCLMTHIDEGSVESQRLYLSRRTLLEMLSDRGYLVPYSELTRSLAGFRSVFGNNPDLERLRICLPLISNPSKKILVIFCGTDVRVAVIRTILGQIVNKESLHRLMLISQGKMNSFAKKEVNRFPVKVEIFQIADLVLNITKHVVMPKHEILTAEAKEKLFKKYKAEDKQEMPCSSLMGYKIIIQEG